jgi:hypothetical protein
MATINPTRLETGSVAHWQWSGLVASGDVGVAVPIPKNKSITVQTYGTFAGGLTVKYQGSLDLENPVNWFDLTDQAGTVIAHTAGDGSVVAENVKWIRPLASAGSGGGNATAVVFAVR